MLETVLEKWLSRQKLLLALAMETPPSDPRVAQKLEGQLGRSLSRLMELPRGGEFAALLLEWSKTRSEETLGKLEGEEFAPLRQVFCALVEGRK